MKKLLFIVCICCFVTQIYAQKIPITGKVIDEKGEPLIGAGIKIKNGTEGTATDANGKFSLQAANGATLTVSYVGYKSIDVKATSQPLTISLAPDGNTDLDEVVVIGYGTTKKATLTGAVASVSGKDVLDTRNENLLNSLSGKLAGVRIVQNTAQPGSFNTLYDIRGFAANGGGGAASPPLIVIDGIPRGGDVLARLDPNDIESVSVLKDASAAVYGVQAANGVILVTTRKGKAGNATITYSVNGGLQKGSYTPTLVGAADWLTLINESTMHNIANPTITYPQSTIDQYTNGTLKSTNWNDAVLNKTAQQWQHSLTVSGASDKVNYFLSFGYQTQNGLYKSNSLSYDKYNFRSNVEGKIAKNLTVNLQLSGISDVTNAPYDSPFDIFGNLWREPPTQGVYANNDPAYLSNTTGNYGVNPVALSSSSISGYQLNKNHYFNSGLSVAWDVPFVPGLQAKAFYGYDYTTTDNKSYQQQFTLYDPILPATTPATYSPHINYSPSDVNRSYSETGVGFLQFSLNYNHVFAKAHNVQVLALYEERTTNADNFSANRQEILNSDQLAAGSTTNQVGTQNLGGAGTVATKSYVGKVHYDYQSKYLLDVTGRYDGSSAFAPSKQWGFFPAASAAYRISEESFIKNNKAFSFVDNIKLRGSYGVLGDAAGASGFNFLSGYNYPASGNVQTLPGGTVLDGNYVNGVGFRGLTNPDITWYTSHTADVGIDVDLWKGLFGFQIDLFNRNRNGLLATRLLSIPGSVGATLPQENINSDQTRGGELVLTSHTRAGDLGINLSGNISYARTKWIHYESAPQGSDYADWANNGYKNGRYNDVYWGYGYVGQYTSFQQIRAYPVNNGGGNRSAVPGDYIYQDYNHDGYFDGGDIHPVAIGYSTSGSSAGNATSPIINYGFNMQFNYKGFDLTALWQGVAGKYVSYGIDLSYPLDHGGNAYTKFLDRWHPTDPTANPFNPNTAYTPGFYAYTGTNINQSSTGPGGINSAAYLRLKTLEFGYTLPAKLTKKVGVSRLRIYANAYDLLTFTGLIGEDPEHTEDLFGEEYPLVHTFNVGINATF